MTGLTFGVAATTRRFEAPDQQQVWISGHRGVVLSDITITGSAAAGIFIDEASRFRIERPKVSDTRADGVHITGGSPDGVDCVRAADDGRVDGSAAPAAAPRTSASRRQAKAHLPRQGDQRVLARPVPPGRSGLLTEPDDVHALRRAIRRVAGADWDRAAVRESAEEFSAERFRARMRWAVQDMIHDPTDPACYEHPCRSPARAVHSGIHVTV